MQYKKIYLLKNESNRICETLCYLLGIFQKYKKRYSIGENDKVDVSLDILEKYKQLLPVNNNLISSYNIINSQINQKIESECDSFIEIEVKELKSNISEIGNHVSKLINELLQVNISITHNIHDFSNYIENVKEFIDDFALEALQTIERFNCDCDYVFNNSIVLRKSFCDEFKRTIKLSFPIPDAHEHHDYIDKLESIIKKLCDIYFEQLQNLNNGIEKLADEFINNQKKWAVKFSDDFQKKLRAFQTSTEFLQFKNNHVDDMSNYHQNIKPLIEGKIESFKYQYIDFSFNNFYSLISQFRLDLLDLVDLRNKTKIVNSYSIYKSLTKILYENEDKLIQIFDTQVQLTLLIQLNRTKELFAKYINDLLLEIKTSILAKIEYQSSYATKHFTIQQDEIKMVLMRARTLELEIKSILMLA